MAYYPRLSRFFGSVNASIFFSQLAYWQDRTDNPLGTYKTAEEWEEETGLSYREQVTARKHLTSQGFLVETHKRLEHKVFYRLDFSTIDAAFGEWTNRHSPNCASSSSPNDENAVRGQRFPQFVSKTETPTETPTETTKEGEVRAQAPAAPVFPKLDDFDAEQAEAEHQAAQVEASRLAAEQSAEAARLAAEQGDAARVAAADQAAEKAKGGKPAKPTKAAETAHAIACPADVPIEVFADFLTIRKSKRAPLTNTALTGIRREAGKAGLSLADALAVCCERGWVGFRADWHSDSGALASAKTARPVAETFRERDERLARERMASFLPSIAARPVARPAAPVRPGTVIDVTPSKTFPSLEA